LIEKQELRQDLMQVGLSNQEWFKSNLKTDSFKMKSKYRILLRLEANVALSQPISIKILTQGLS